MSESLNNIGLTGGFAVGSSGWGDPMNSNIALIDALLQPRAINITNSVPGSPANSDLYIVGGSPTGDFAGKAKNLAVFVGEWVFISPKAGFQVYLISESVNYIFDGTNWNVLPSQGETGPKGDQGDQGPQGDRGEKGEPGQDATPTDVLSTTLTGLESLSVTGSVIESDTILRAIAKLRAQISTITAPPDYGDVHDIGGEGYYPFSQSDGTLYTDTQNIVIPAGFYRIAASGILNIVSSNTGDTSVTRTLTGELLIEGKGNGDLFGGTQVDSRSFGIAPTSSTGAQGWTDVDTIQQRALKYLFSTAPQIAKGANGLPGHTGGKSGTVVISNIIHFVEPTELTLKIGKHYDNGYFDMSTAGTGFVWIREVIPE